MGIVMARQWRPKRLRKPGRYAQIIEHSFFAHYESGLREVSFERAEVERVAAELGIANPKNVGDNISRYRFRATLPVRPRS
jgi:hypothetical protein